MDSVSKVDIGNESIKSFCLRVTHQWSWLLSSLSGIVATFASAVVSATTGKEPSALKSLLGYRRNTPPTIRTKLDTAIPPEDDEDHIFAIAQLEQTL